MTDAQRQRLLISYDLRKPNYKEEDYTHLYAELELLDAKKVQESVWVVRTNRTVNSVFETLRRHMHRHDRLLVAQIQRFRSVNAVHLVRFI